MPFFKFLDQAIASTAEEELESLIKSKKRIELRIAAEYAAKSFKGLRADRLPDYNDPLVSILYLTQYHIAQVNLISAILDKLREQDKGLFTRPTRIFDLGCGAMATQFAITRYLRNAIESNDLVPDERHMVYIDNLDTSRAIMELGKKTVDKFNEAINESTKDKGKSLKSAAKIIRSSDRVIETIGDGVSVFIPSLPIDTRQDSNGNTGHRSLRFDKHILFAMHAFYEDGARTLQSTLRFLQRKFNPDIIVFASFEKKANLVYKAMENIREAFKQLKDYQLNDYDIKNLNESYDGPELDRVVACRNTMSGRLDASDVPHLRDILAAVPRSEPAPARVLILMAKKDG